jgi:hypothetical protein
MQYKVETDGQNRLGLDEVCRQFADSLWLPTHVTHDEAAEIALDLFKRTVAGELELLRVTANQAAQSPP